MVNVRRRKRVKHRHFIGSNRMNGHATAKRRNDKRIFKEANYPQCVAIKRSLAHYGSIFTFLPIYGCFPWFGFGSPICPFW